MHAAQLAFQCDLTSDPSPPGRLTLILSLSLVRAVLESLDNGKPIRESRDADINVVARWLYHYAGWAQILDREMPEMTSVGVVAGIVAWNFPLMLLVWKVRCFC